MVLSESIAEQVVLYLFLVALFGKSVQATVHFCQSCSRNGGYVICKIVFQDFLRKGVAVGSIVEEPRVVISPHKSVTVVVDDVGRASTVQVVIVGLGIHSEVA